MKTLKLSTLLCSCVLTACLHPNADDVCGNLDSSECAIDRFEQRVGDTGEDCAEAVRAAPINYVSLNELWSICEVDDQRVVGCTVFDNETGGFDVYVGIDHPHANPTTTAAHEFMHALLYCTSRTPWNRGNPDGGHRTQAWGDLM